MVGQDVNLTWQVCPGDGKGCTHIRSVVGILSRLAETREGRSLEFQHDPVFVGDFGLIGDISCIFADKLIIMIILYEQNKMQQLHLCWNW